MPDPVPLPHREVAVGLIVAGDGRLLLQLRDDRPGLPGAGMWGLFGGHLEPGEPPARAFLREIDEELGWRPQHFEPYITREVDRDDWRVISHVFAAHLDAPLDHLTLGEGRALQLFPPDALPRRAVPGIVSLIRDFAASDAYRRVKHRYDIITTTGLLVDREGRFLLQLRDDKPGIDNPGRWGSFGGRVERYEPPDDGFVRELREELEWAPETFELYAGVPYHTDKRRQLVYCYAALVDVPLDRLILHEGQDMTLFPPDALPPTIVPDLRTLIERFVTSEMYTSVRRRD